VGRPNASEPVFLLGAHQTFFPFFSRSAVPYKRSFVSFSPPPILHPRAPRREFFSPLFSSAMTVKMCKLLSLSAPLSRIKWPMVLFLLSFSFFGDFCCRRVYSPLILSFSLGRLSLNQVSLHRFQPPLPFAFGVEKDPAYLFFPPPSFPALMSFAQSAIFPFAGNLDSIMEPLEVRVTLLGDSGAFPSQRPFSMETLRVEFTSLGLSFSK